MGEINGVVASRITEMYGIDVNLISEVCGVSAASIGLGGGGKLYTVNSFDNPRAACMFGREAQSQTLYYNSNDNTFYLDPDFRSIFSGDGGFYYSSTDNSWAQISGEGLLANAGKC
jgi:hypothetical protein